MEAEQIARARELAGFTRTRAADLLGVAPRTLARWESGSQTPSPASRAALRALFAPYDGSDEAAMAEALRLARLAAAVGETPVGCVIVSDGRIVGRGRNRRERDRSALAHAEIEAIGEACRTLGGWRLWRAALYVTLEPCPMCAGAILNARIRRVWYGARDRAFGACGGVTNLFMENFPHAPALVGGVLEADCQALLSDFFRRLRANS